MAGGAAAQCGRRGLWLGVTVPFSQFGCVAPGFGSSPLAAGHAGSSWKKAGAALEARVRTGKVGERAGPSARWLPVQVHGYPGDSVLVWAGLRSQV